MARGQKPNSFAGRSRPGLNQPFHPERWLRWVERCRSTLDLSRQQLERAVQEAAAHLVPLPLNGQNWAVGEVYPTARRGRTRRTWQAYWIGEAIRAVQRPRIDHPLWTSGLESLSFGGYYGDLIAIIALAVADPAASDTILLDASTFSNPQSACMIETVGIDGRATMNGAYEEMLDESYFCFQVHDTAPFSAALSRWLSTGRQQTLPWAFEVSRACLATGDEVHALELFRTAVAIASTERLGEDVTNSSTSRTLGTAFQSNRALGVHRFRLIAVPRPTAPASPARPHPQVSAEHREPWIISVNELSATLDARAIRSRKPRSQQ
jgi:hypothetical protein